MAQGNSVKTGMVAVMKFVEMSPGEFKTEWAALSDEEKAQFKKGIGDFNEMTKEVTGNLTY